MDNNRQKMPPTLEVGDEVIILSPSSKIDKRFVAGAQKRLQSWGLKVRKAPHVLSANGTYAGSMGIDIREQHHDECRQYVLAKISITRHHILIICIIILFYFFSKIVCYLANGYCPMGYLVLYLHTQFSK